MNIRFASLLLLAALAYPSFVNAAETNPPSPFTQNGTAPPAHHDLIQGEHVEGHIAFLRAELGITPAQESLWGQVAVAMREDVKTLQDADNRVTSQQDGRQNALQYLQNRALFARLRADGEARFLAAFRPLYESLSPQQKQVADDLLIPDEPN